jgi:hypothetical protein
VEIIALPREHEEPAMPFVASLVAFFELVNAFTPEQRADVVSFPEWQEAMKGTPHAP